MLNRYLKTVLFLFIIGVLGCGRHHSETIVAVVGDYPITLEEYETMYINLNLAEDTAQESSLETRKEFLDLLVRFHLKVKDAYDLGLHSHPEVVSEITDYKKSLAKTYLIERELIDPNLHEMYERRKEEMRASHILIRVSPDAPPEDTLAAYQRAMEVINRISSGESFEEVALEVSEDPGVRENKGDLFYLTGGVMFRPIENTLFNLNEGEVSPKPVRTQFGYHVLKVHSRKPYPGRIRLSQILKAVEPNASPEDTLAAYELMHSILDSLKADVDFGELAERHSDHPRSVRQRGDIGVYNRRNLPEGIGNIAYSLQQGEISEVVRSEFGYHILKLTDIVPLPAYENLQEELRRQYQERYMDDDYAKYIDALKEKHNLSVFDESLDALKNNIDTVAVVGEEEWVETLSLELLSLPLFSVAGREYLIKEIIENIQTNPEYIGKRLTASYLDEIVDGEIESKVLLQEAAKIEVKYPDFREKIEEYQRGLLRYFVEDKRIWSKINFSDETLKSFYEKTKEEYRVNDEILPFEEVRARVASMYQTKVSEKLEAEWLEELKKRYPVSYNYDALNEAFSARNDDKR